MKKNQKLNYTFLILKTYTYTYIYTHTHTLKFKKLFIQKKKKKKDHTCLNVFSNWLSTMWSATRFLGEKWDGSKGNGYLCQSSNFNPLGRYSRRPWQCILQIVSVGAFFGGIGLPPAVMGWAASCDDRP